MSFTKGRIIVRSKLVTRGQAKRADYILYFKPNIPLALIEAKDNSRSVGDGIQQGLDYAATLDIPFVFSSNGDGFVFHDRTGVSNPREANIALDIRRRCAITDARYSDRSGESEIDGHQRAGEQHRARRLPRCRAAGRLEAHGELRLGQRFRRFVRQEEGRRRARPLVREEAER